MELKSKENFKKIELLDRGRLRLTLVFPTCRRGFLPLNCHRRFILINFSLFRLFSRILLFSTYQNAEGKC